MLNTVMPLSKWKRHTHRLNGCHTVPEGIIALLKVLPNFKVKGEGKAIPLQAWSGPEGSRRLRLPDFKTIGT
jgi:hypothetical protein